MFAHLCKHPPWQNERVTASFAAAINPVERLDEVFTKGRVGPVWYAGFMQPADDFDRDRHERFALETVAAFTTTIREGLG